MGDVNAKIMAEIAEALAGRSRNEGMNEIARKLAADPALRPNAPQADLGQVQRLTQRAPAPRALLPAGPNQDPGIAQRMLRWGKGQLPRYQGSGISEGMKTAFRRIPSALGNQLPGYTGSGLPSGVSSALGRGAGALGRGAAGLGRLGLRGAGPIGAAISIGMDVAKMWDATGEYTTLGNPFRGRGEAEEYGETGMTQDAEAQIRQHNRLVLALKEKEERDRVLAATGSGRHAVPPPPQPLVSHVPQLEQNTGPEEASPPLQARQYSPEGYEERMRDRVSGRDTLGRPIEVGRAGVPGERPLEPRPPDPEVEAMIRESGGLSPTSQMYQRFGGGRASQKRLSSGGGLGDAAWRAQMRGQQGAFTPSQQPPSVEGMEPAQFAEARRAESPAIQRLMDEEWGRLRQLEAQQRAIEAQEVRTAADRALVEKAQAEASAIERQGMTVPERWQEYGEAEGVIDQHLAASPAVDEVLKNYEKQWVKDNPDQPVTSEMREEWQRQAVDLVKNGYIDPETGAPVAGQADRMMRRDPDLARYYLASGLVGG